MKVLIYDLETAPSLAYIWKLWKENIGINQLVDVGRVICWAAKWLGDEEVYYSNETTAGHQAMIQGLYDLLCEADVIVAYNGNNFDRPVMQAEFLRYNLVPPVPTKQIDVYQEVKKQFKLVSRRMQFVAEYLGLDTKLETGGFSLWARCLEGDPEAWEEMTEYNIQDVIVLEQIYLRVRPWIANHPNVALYSGLEGLACPNCGSTHLQKRGVARTGTAEYQRYQCQDCGTWSRKRLQEKGSHKPELTQDKTR